MTAETTNSPGFGDLVKMTKSGWDGIPDGPNPFYVGSKSGLFIHKRMLIGRGIAKVNFWPASFPEMPDAQGMFDFTADPIPAKLMGQVVNFFERIYDRQHTEAAVLLTMHAETKEWRIFVPTQLVSHGGVNYVFEPTDIKYPWVLVGSIHSHCDFGAGHSSTDTGDADGFDGLHMTTGFIKRDIPQIVAMVATNKQLFHFKNEQFPDLFDYSEVKQHEAPEWWDRYVENTKTKEKPVGFELYAKYDRPTVVKSEAKKTVQQPFKPSPGFQPSGYNPSDWVYSAEERRMVRVSGDKVGKGQNGLTVITTESGGKLRRLEEPNQNVQRRRENFMEGLGYAGAPRKPIDPTDDWDDFYRLLGVEQAPSDFASVSPTDLLEAGYSWNADDRTWHWTGGSSPKTLEEIADEILKRDDGRLNESHEFNREQLGRVVRPATEQELKKLGLQKEEPFWEDTLPGELVGQFLGSNLVTDEDLDYVNDFPERGGTIEFWQHLMMRKALAACETLQMMGVEASVTVKMNSKPPADLDMELLPETPKVIHLPGGETHEVQKGLN